MFYIQTATGKELVPPPMVSSRISQAVPGIGRKMISVGTNDSNLKMRDSAEPKEVT
jgi:hypothetical protein